MSLPSEADAVLRNAVPNGDVPGVVATATDRDGTIYEGAFGEPYWQRRRHESGHRRLVASMTKALTGTAERAVTQVFKLAPDERDAWVNWPDVAKS